MEANLSLFLLSAVGISLTGIMMPGPMTAATIVKGYSSRNAGIPIAVGHAVVEIPLIAAIYFGLGRLIGSPQVMKGIYIVGALMLFYLGFRMFRIADNAVGDIGGLPTSSLVTGIVINRYQSRFLYMVGVYRHSLDSCYYQIWINRHCSLYCCALAL